MFLTWCTETDVTTFCQEYKEKVDKSFANDKESIGPRNRFIRRMIKNTFSSCVVKRDHRSKGKNTCVKHLSDKRDCAKPPPLEEYSANVLCIPDFVTEIAKVSVYRLRGILRVHNVLDSGNKDELVA